jgi:hypothetical protein
MRVVCLLSCLLLVQPSSIHGEEVAVAIPLNLRAESDLLHALQAGMMHSRSFRVLVDQLAQSNLIIYLEQTRLSGGLDGALRLVTAAGGFRYVRISIDARLSADALVAMLGHELQHAAEIAVAPEVVDQASMARLYGRIGFPCGTRSTFDTRAAVHVQEQVRKELRAD